ncbi:MAG TPA: thiolase family protein [Elusimicrobiota bacterium]|nr:thiolase family protein [Elusimicrobiota bacterium]
MTPEIFILSGARTPFAVWSRGEKPEGGKGGALAGTDPFDLAGAAAGGALSRAGFSTDALDFIVFGNCYHVGPHACYGARYVAQRLQADPRLTGTTVNLACGAGLEALRVAAEEIASGRHSLVLACGADVSSRVPLSTFVPSFNDVWCGRAISETSQAVAKEMGVSRKEQDAWAAQSHRRAAAARAAGLFREEIVPVAEVIQDDAIRENPNDDYFAKAKILYEGGDATSANTHAIVDGGSALILADAKAATGKKPLGRLVGAEVVGLLPERMAEGSAAAIKKLLSRLSWPIASVDLFEINETFASQTLVDLKELGLNTDKLNVNGGALALGHPFGGTGARLIHTLLLELARRGEKRGVAAICVGGGLGIAAAVERL